MATITITTRDAVQLYRGEHDDLRAAVVHCAAAGIGLAYANLRGAVLDGANLSGLFAPHSDLTGASMRGIVADRLVGGRMLDLSAALLHGATISGVLTQANLSCTHPTSLRAELGPGTRVRGCDFSDCPDVLVLARTPRVGVVVAARNGTGWKVHAGDDGCYAEAEAAQHLTRSEYRAPLEWLASAEGTLAKTAIDTRPDAGSIVDGGTRTR